MASEEDVEEFANQLEAHMQARAATPGVRIQFTQGDGTVCFDPKWKRLHDLKRVLTEEWQAVGDRDRGLYEIVTNFSTVVQQTLGISEADRLREEALVLD